LLFECGRRLGPTLPNPELQARPPTLTPGELPAPAQQQSEPVSPPPPPPVPDAPKAEPEAQEQPPPPAAEPPLEATPTPPEPAPPQPAPIPLPPRAPIPPPPAEEPMPIPPQPPPSPVQPLPVPAQPPPPLRPPQARPAAKPAPPPKPSDFPAPMDFSFGRPLAPPSPARAARAPRIPGTIDMSLGPASKGTADPTPYSDRDAEIAGADYRNALSRWVAEHAYYPEQARRGGDEGDAKVHVLAAPDGRVKSVELIGKSGSMWLDLALLSLFRDQHIPPYPGGGGEPIEFNFTMHYVLIRPR
jgi:protein TonB